MSALLRDWSRATALPSILAALALTMLTLVAAPAAKAAVSSTPDRSLVTDGTVNAVARSADTIYLGGDFSQIGPRIGHLAALSASSGEVDASMPEVSGADGVVNAMVSDGSGGFFIGGHFTHVGGFARNSLAHIRADKSVDPGWNPNANGPVNAMARSGSILYIGGSFNGANSINGTLTRNRLAAIDTTTGIANGWDPNSNSVVAALDLSADGSIVYFGGNFGGPQAINGNVTRTRLAAVDATTGVVTAWDPQANGSVRTLVVSGGLIYVGGDFSGANSIGTGTRNFVARLTTAGALGAWNPNASGPVHALAVAGTTVYIGGAFSGAGAINGNASLTRNRAAAVNLTTGVATGWNPDASATVRALAVVGSTVYLGGLFKGPGSINGSLERNRLAAVDATTGAATAWNPNANGPVLSLAVLGATVYAGGAFASLGGQSRDNLAALNAADGTLRSWDPDASGPVDALQLSGSTVYIGGEFNGPDSINGSKPRNRAAAVDATTGAATDWNPDAGGPVLALAVSGSTVYMGGSFLAVNNGTPRNRLAAVDATTGTANGWDPNASGGVRALAVSGSTVYVGGSFQGINNPALVRNRLAAVDATTGVANSWNPDAVGGAVDALALSGSTVYVGGSFQGINNPPLLRSGLAAVDATTGIANGWDPKVSGLVHALAVSGSTVYVGGQLEAINNLTLRRGLAAVDASTGIANGWDPSTDGQVNALALDGGGGVIAGGSFSTLDLGAQQGIAAFSEAPAGTAAPLVGGPLQVGETLTCSEGGWLGSPPLTFSYQWLRDGAAIASATAAGYTLADADVGHELRCQVAAANRAGGATATSAPVAFPAVSRAAASFSLSVSKAGGGAGSVTSSPGGIDCGAACTAGYDDGTNVTLTATPAGGSRFDGWSGDCTGTGACSVAMTAGRSVTATFTPLGIAPEGITKAATLAKSAFTATARGVVTLPIGNPNAVLAQGEVTLTTKRGKRTVAIGRKRFKAPANGVARVKVKLNQAGRALLKKGKTLKVKARILLSANGTSKPVTRSITIKAPRRR
jgi:trimeric autotransporter adhesin